MKTTTSILIAFVCTVHAKPFTEGQIDLVIQQGERVLAYRYLKKGSQVRINYPGKQSPAAPINLIDLKNNEFRILRPHNSTWVLVPAELLKVRKSSAFPTLPQPTKGIGAHPTPAGQPGWGAGATAMPKMPPGIGPQSKKQTPGAAPPSVVTKMPVMPNPKLPDGVQLPAGFGPQAGGDGIQTPGMPNIPGVPAMPNIPGMPPQMPNMPGMPGSSPEMKLVAGKDIQTLHGYRCKKYTLHIPREGALTLWLSDAADLPPFHLLTYEPPRQRGRIEWQQQWPALLRELKLFPMLVVLRTEPEKNRRRPSAEKAKDAEKREPAKKPEGREIRRWQVTGIKHQTIQDKNGNLFTVPKNYHKMDPLPF